VVALKGNCAPRRYKVKLETAGFGLALLEEERMNTFLKAVSMALPALLLVAAPASARMSRMQAVETCVAQAHQAMGTNNNPFDTSANSRAGVGIYSGCMRNLGFNP
jgi:hypothetical protein